MATGRPRLRGWGISIGTGRPGPRNAITDVSGVRVGHTTLISGEGPPHPGEGPVRTGVTVVLPHGEDRFRHKARAAVHTLNGYGKVWGFEQVRELGFIEALIALTNTLNVPLVADALIQHAIHRNPQIGIRTSSVLDHGSGDFVIAFTITSRVDHGPRTLVADRATLVDEGRAMRGLFPAVVESVEEAVLNSLWRAETVVGRDGHTRHALPLEDVAELVDAYNLR